MAKKRWQLSRILSNTGAASATELLMTLRISAEAVCRSSASRVSLNSRTFSMAITAWSAKVRSRSACSGENGPGSTRVTLMAPANCPSRTIGTLSIARNPRLRATSRHTAGSSACVSVFSITIVWPAFSSRGKKSQSSSCIGERAFSASIPAGLVVV